MPQQNRSTLKGYFFPTAFPTDVQFHNFLDSVFIKGEDQVAMGDIGGLLATLNGKANISIVNALLQRILPEEFTWNTDEVLTVPSGLHLDFVVVIPSVNITDLRIGRSAGSEDLHPSGSGILYGGEAYRIDLGVTARGADLDIFFTGITPNCTLIFYKR